MTKTIAISVLAMSLFSNVGSAAKTQGGRMTKWPTGRVIERAEQTELERIAYRAAVRKVERAAKKLRAVFAEDLPKPVEGGFGEWRMPSGRIASRSSTPDGVVHASTSRYRGTVIPFADNDGKRQEVSTLVDSKTGNGRTATWQAWPKAQVVYNVADPGSQGRRLVYVDGGRSYNFHLDTTIGDEYGLPHGQAYEARLAFVLSSQLKYPGQLESAKAYLSWFPTGRSVERAKQIVAASKP